MCQSQVKEIKFKEYLKLVEKNKTERIYFKEKIEDIVLKIEKVL